MKLSKIEVNNFRLLRENFTLDVKDELSLIVGKNNSGKTSLLQILQKFLSDKNQFKFEDFSLTYQKQILDKLDQGLDQEEYDKTGINLSLRLHVSFDNVKDNLQYISNLILDLDPTNTTLLLEFRYELPFDKYLEIKKDFDDYELASDKIDFLKKHHKAYFNVTKEVVNANDANDRLPIKDTQVNQVINLQSISAKRDVMNDDGESSKEGKTLSKLSYKFFKPNSDTNDQQIVGLQKALIETDKVLTSKFKVFFNDIVNDVKDFSYDGAKIQVKSNFEEINLMRENTSVVYEDAGHLLPEDYNGLGYMNLFSMIFELHIIFNNFKKVFFEKSYPAEVNILFIEEPEAHTHPQMQYVFIQKVKEFLAKRKSHLSLQTLLTTHSSHITSQSNFNDIRYFLNKGDYIEVKNLSDLEQRYTSSGTNGIENFKFLKKYLTLNRAELFFTDKAIIIEGDTERILLPAMMQKLDGQKKSEEGYKKLLLSQNISTIEIGAHSKVFEHFLDFLEIKTLIITDVDYSKVKEIIDKNGNKKNTNVAASPKEAENTTNSTLNHFFNKPDAKTLKEFDDTGHIVELPNSKSPVYIAFQKKENQEYVRSFEDAFLSHNLDFLKDKKDDFSSLKNKKQFDDASLSVFVLANNCIGKKTEFATDILYYSDENYSQWKTPDYINKGLVWLQQD